MDKKLLVGIGSGILLGVLSILWLLTVPVIERFEEVSRNVSYVGGGFSTYNVTYIDHRLGLAHEGASSIFWRGMDESEKEYVHMNEWRQVGFVPYHWRYQWVTDRVLRDVAYQNSRFGVGRGMPEAYQLQRHYEEVIRVYKAQSVFDRVWQWRVKEFH